MSLRWAIAVVLLLAATASEVAAQGIELQALLGGRFGGVIDATDSRVGEQLVEVDVRPGLVWGGSLGVDVSDRWQVEFLFSRQETTMDLGSAKLFNSSLSQFHGNVLYHFGDPDARVRPYALAGAGATLVDSCIVGVESQTGLSYGVGGGVKIDIYDMGRYWLRAQARVTPTRLRADPVFVCDTGGFCFGMPGDSWINQAEFTVGFTVRF